MTITFTSYLKAKIKNKNVFRFRGGSRIFSRGVDFQKNFGNFDDLFLGRPI